MKKLFLSLLLFMSFYLNLFCQDILVLKSGDELKVKVSEVLPDVIKYKKWDNQDGPVYSEPKANIFMIKYQNGSKDVFSNNEIKNSNVSNTVNKFLGDWRCNIGSGGIINEGDEMKISIAGGNITVELNVAKNSVQNTGVLENDKIKVSFPVLGETIITYSEVLGKPRVYVFGTEMNKSLKSSSSSAYTGLLSLDSTQAIVSVIFKSITDEIVSHEEVLVNKITYLLRSNKRMKGISSSGIDIENIPFRYQLEYQFVTFYDAKASVLNPGSIAYTAQLRLQVFLWKLDKSGRRIKGVPTKNILIRKESALGGGYMSKQGAFDALLPQIDNAFYQQFYSLFPVNGRVTEITDVSKKGDPKKVKISSGINQGVMKDFKFRINDNNRKKEDYDLIVDQLFDDYSICTVKNNESLIADRFKSNDKVWITTNLKPEDNYDIEAYESKTNTDSKIVKIINGSWIGNVTVKGLKDPVGMQFSSNTQFNEFKVSYPSYGCSGTWSIEQSSNETIDFRETLLVGRCQTGSLIKVNFVNDNQIALEYYDPKSKKIVAHGTLTKE